jgi:hypothetical protein
MCSAHTISDGGQHTRALDWRALPFRSGRARGKVVCEGAVFQLFQAFDDGLGVYFGPGPGGMLVVGKTLGGLFLAQGVVVVRSQAVEVDEERAAGPGGLGGPLGIAVKTAFDFSIHPGIARDGRTEDDGGAFGLRVFHVLPHIPAVGVDGYGLGAGANNDDFVATGINRGAVRMVVRVFGVVVAEHNDDEIAGLHAREIFCPQPFADIAAAAASAGAFVVDVDFGGIEQGSDFVTHPVRAVVAGWRTGLHDGIADEKQGGVKRGFGRWLSRCVSRRGRVLRPHNGAGKSHKEKQNQGVKKAKRGVHELLS